MQCQKLYNIVDRNYFSPGMTCLHIFLRSIVLQVLRLIARGGLEVDIFSLSPLHSTRCKSGLYWGRNVHVAFYNPESNWNSSGLKLFIVFILVEWV